MGAPHNSAIPEGTTKTVLMPGDPLRAEFIAKNWLTNVKLVSKVRNIYTFTDKFERKEITIIVNGMGMPSIGIYSYGLFTRYGVERIIRIGSAGAHSRRLKLYDVVLAEECWSESSFGQTRNGDASDIKYPDPELNQMVLEAENKYEIEVVPAKIHSSDVFYSESGMDSFQETYAKHGNERVEMESFTPSHSAKVLGKKATCLLTISDSFIIGEKATMEERQGTFGNMMKVALRTAAMMVD